MFDFLKGKNIRVQSINEYGELGVSVVLKVKSFSIEKTVYFNILTLIDEKDFIVEVVFNTWNVCENFDHTYEFYRYGKYPLLEIVLLEN